VRRKSLGFRTQRRYERQRRFRRRAAIIFLAAILVILGIFLAYKQAWLKPPRSSAPKIVPKKSKPSSQTKKRISCLIVAAKPNAKEASELRLFVFDRAAEKLNLVSIPPNTLVDIPGYGFEKIGQALAVGSLSNLLSAMRNFLGVKIDYWIKLDDKDFKRLTDENDLAGLFSRPYETNLSLNQRLQLAKEIGQIDLIDINTFSLPVKLIRLGETTYAEPKKEEVDQLVARIFDIKTEKRSKITRVVVLNGSGAPGIAGKVAEKLIQNGYKVVESKNADNFDYQVTQIINFRADSQAVNKIRILLGTGVITRKKPLQNLVDIAVIVGKDYQGSQ